MAELEIKRMRNELQELEMRQGAATANVQQSLLGGTVPTDHLMKVSTRKFRPENKRGVQLQGHLKWSSPVCRHHNMWSSKV